MSYDGPPECAAFFELVEKLGGTLGSVRADLVTGKGSPGWRIVCATFDGPDDMRAFLDNLCDAINTRPDLHPLGPDVGSGFGTCIGGRHFIYWPRVTIRATVN